MYLVAWTPTRRPGLAASQAGFRDAEDSLHELAELSRSAGAEVVGSSSQRSPRADPATLIGRGKLEEIKGLALGQGVQCIIFDHDLSPTQMRNLEQAFGLNSFARTVAAALTVVKSRSLVPRNRPGHKLRASLGMTKRGYWSAKMRESSRA